MCTSKSGLQLIINYLHAHFGRPVTGVYNCTYGFWFDLLECIIQRDFSIPTDDIRLGYSVSRAEPCPTGSARLRSSVGAVQESVERRD
jgi:hypothetical protein